MNDIWIMIKAKPLAALLATLSVVLFAPAASAEIRVVLAAPITGPIAVGGEQATRGARRAVDDINMAGGINGEKLVLEIEDDACDPKQALSVANRIVDRGASLVVGHICSSPSMLASKVYEEESIVMISPASTNPKLTDEGGWNVFRVCGRDDAQGELAGRYLARRYAGRKVAIVDDKSAFGKGITAQARAAMNSAGLKEVLNESINAGEKDFSALIVKMKNIGVDAIYFGGFHPEAGQILKQMEVQDLQARMFAGDAMSTAELWQIAGPSARNLFFTFPPDPRNSAGAKEIIETFRKGGYDPEAYTLYTYAAFELYRAAAEATGSIDSRKIADWLRAGNPVKTVIGEITLDGKGDVTNPAYSWFTFNNGTTIEVGNPD